MGSASTRDALLVSSADPPADGLDDEARQALRTYRRRAWIWAVVGFALLVGFTVAATVVEQRAEELERTGARLPGAVADVRSLGENGSIIVEFAWQAELRREIVRLDAESPRYREGQRVTVVVDRDDPEHVSILGETNESERTVLPMLLAFVGGLGMMLIGVWALARARRQRRQLRRTCWRRVPCRYAEIPSGKSVRALIVLEEADGSQPILTLASIVRWRLRGTGLRQATAVEVAGDSTSHVVLRVPGGGPLLSARPPRTSGAERRWRRAVDETSH